jgi:hypothetical protein
MQPDAAALLWDARRAAQLILDFVADKTWPEYQADVMLRSAVERQFEIIGESLNRLSRADPLTAADLEDLPRHTGPGCASCAQRKVSLGRGEHGRTVAGGEDRFAAVQHRWSTSGSERVRVSTGDAARDSADVTYCDRVSTLRTM